ncbi:unnamed protein product [Menidia menidia]|uniref:(Atlantic silverside) hypothetical protein n=1 Tax=Menidia menidia TaxID=238744 RepID=A0A8S4BCY7_9TELE|nr:unnamed protein product [Menidia menidia]
MWVAMVTPQRLAQSCRKPPDHAGALSLRPRAPHPAQRLRCYRKAATDTCKMREAAILLTTCGVVCLLLSASHAARPGQDVRCGACRALVDEMEWAISQIDPKKTIQAGSFRINPDGSQSIREIPLARSEGNLLELMESVCERMEDYGERMDPSSNRKSYIRVKSRTGEAMDLSEASLDSRVTSSLKFACETIVEQHEDELIEFFGHETDNVKDKLCSKRTDLCDHALLMPHDEL